MDKTKSSPQNASLDLKIQSCLFSLGHKKEIISEGFVSLKQKGLLKTRVTTPRQGSVKIGILQNKQ